nr:hypothetical protein [Vibrio splendidus]MCC4882757.1 hypothetical protein [Vibrio splendidus]
MTLIRTIVFIIICIAAYACSVIAVSVGNDLSVTESMSYITDKAFEAKANIVDYAVGTIEDGVDRVESSSIMQSIDANKELTDITAEATKDYR